MEQLGQLFPLGHIVATPSALEALAEAKQDPSQYIKRHAAGDWGELEDGSDIKENVRGLAEGLRLLSAYTLPTGARIWIITEDDRSATTILLPEDY